MMRRFWPRDTIAGRFALAILLALLMGVALTWLVLKIAGVWGLPSLERTGLVGQARDIVRMVEAAPPAERTVLAAAAGEGNPFKVNWYPTTSAVAIALDTAAKLNMVNTTRAQRLGMPHRSILHFSAARPEPSVLGADDPSAQSPTAQLFAVSLNDGGWIVFTLPRHLWGLPSQARVGIGVVFLILSIVMVTVAATFQLSRPIRNFTEALRRFGTDPRASPLPETGPAELRVTIAAFNATQKQVQRFVEDRTVMLAAISHDLRTPLTKMRLRGELIEDEDQRLRLFRDVDDMQAMVDSALSFFRESMDDEETTRFDLPELLRTITDDLSDHGISVPYEGPAHLTYVGRPLALKRAFTNLIDNGVKYGNRARVELRVTGKHITIFVRDSGPGIPSSERERVFAPFFRLEGSRNRLTGGVGLGLTSARTILRAHGGDIVLRNQPEQGLEVEVLLPLL
jgi:signal transduction histidine kinase